MHPTISGRDTEALWLICKFLTLTVYNYYFSALQIKKKYFGPKKIEVRWQIPASTGYGSALRVPREVLWKALK